MTAENFVPYEQYASLLEPGMTAGELHLRVCARFGLDPTKYVIVIARPAWWDDSRVTDLSEIFKSGIFKIGFHILRHGDTSMGLTTSIPPSARVA